MADLRGTLIHTDRDLSHDLVPRDATEPGQDLSLRALDPHHEDEEEEETALAAMVAGGDEAQVIAAIAVMMIGAEAEVVDGEVVVDVSGIEIDITAQEFGVARKTVTLIFKIPMKPVPRTPVDLPLSLDAKALFRKVRSRYTLFAE
jgi:hypothetical protein